MESYSSTLTLFKAFCGKATQTKAAMGHHCYWCQDLEIGAAGMAILPEGDTSMASFLPEDEMTPDLTAFTAASNYALDIGPDYGSSHLVGQKGDDDEEICALMQFSSHLPSYEEVMNLPPLLLHDHTSSSSSTSTSTSGSNQNSLPVSAPSWSCPNQIASIAALCNQTNPSINVKESTHTCSVKESESAQVTSFGLTLDGYKWRKYGKKILKSGPFERNYYKCIRLKCPARKYVDCSFDSTTTFTSYEGTHDNLSCLIGNASHTHRNIKT